MEDKKKNIIIWVLVGIIVVLLGLCIYFAFVKKDDNTIDNNSQNNQQEVDEYNLINKEFKTKDKKFTLKIVSKNDKKAYDDAKNMYHDLDNGKRSYNNDGVIYYGYLNNDVIEIKDIKKVDYYLILDTKLPSASNILINMNANIIDEDESRLLLNDYDRFFGDTGTNWYDVIKVNNGYFITSRNPALEDSNYIVFTTNWKKIGYTSYNPTIDNDGIYVYDNDKLTGSLVKYDVNGNKVQDNNKTSNTTKFTKLEKKELIENNQKITINGKTINLAENDNYLYINGKRSDYQLAGYEYYVTDYLVLLIRDGQCGEDIDYVVDENGKLIKTIKDYGSDWYIVSSSLKIENEKIVAKLESLDVCFCAGGSFETCGKNTEKYDVRFVYDGKTMNIVKIN